MQSHYSVPAGLTLQSGGQHNAFFCLFFSIKGQIVNSLGFAGHIQTLSHIRLLFNPSFKNHSKQDGLSWSRL